MDRNDAAVEALQQVEQRKWKPKKVLADKKVATVKGGGIRRTISRRTGISLYEVIRKGEMFRKLPDGPFGTKGGKIVSGVFYKGGIKSEAEAIIIRNEADELARNNTVANSAANGSGNAAPLTMKLIGKYDEDGKVLEEGLFDMYVRESENPEHGNVLSPAIIGRYEFYRSNPILQAATLGDMGEDLMRRFCVYRKTKDNNKPTSINSDFSYIGNAVKMLASWNKWKGFDPLEGVYKTLNSQGHIAESTSDKHQRRRMPLPHEMPLMIKWFTEHDERVTAFAAKFPNRIQSRNPFNRGADVLMFSLRQGTRIEEQMEGLLLRNLKENPDGTAVWTLLRKDSEGEVHEGRDTKQRLEDMLLVHDAYVIAQRQPSYIAWKKLSPAEQRRSDLVLFPWSKSTVNDAWQKCKAELGLVNLHWHDNRSRAITELCKLFPGQYKEVMKFSGHRTLKALQIYIRMAEEEMAGLMHKTKEQKPLW